MNFIRISDGIILFTTVVICLILSEYIDVGREGMIYGSFLIIFVAVLCIFRYGILVNREIPNPWTAFGPARFFQALLYIDLLLMAGFPMMTSFRTVQENMLFDLTTVILFPVFFALMIISSFFYKEDQNREQSIKVLLTPKDKMFTFIMHGIGAALLTFFMITGVIGNNPMAVNTETYINNMPFFLKYFSLIMLIWILFKFGAQQLLKFNDGLKSKKTSRFFWGVCLGMLISAMVFKERHWFGAHYLFYGAPACYILSIISYFFINTETETRQDVLDDI